MFLWLLACSRNSSPYTVPEVFFILSFYIAQFAKRSTGLVYVTWSWNACASSKDWLKSCQWVQRVTSCPKSEESWKHLCLAERDFPVSVLALGAKPHWGCLNHTVKPKLSSVYGSSLILKDHNSAVLLAGELSCTGHCTTAVVQHGFKSWRYSSVNLQQLSSWENWPTNCVIKKPSFTQCFSELLEQLCRDPRAFWTSCQSSSISEIKVLCIQVVLSPWFIFLQLRSWFDFCCISSEAWSHCGTKHHLGTSPVTVALVCIQQHKQCHFSCFTECQWVVNTPGWW